MSVLDAVADRIARGETLSPDEASAIVATGDIIAIGMLADQRRRHRHGTTATFVRVFETHVDASPGSLPPRVDAGEFRIVGKLTDEEAAVSAVAATARLAGKTPVSGFSLADLLAIAGSTSALSFLCERLHHAGLSAVAEVPVDLLPDAAYAVQAARRGGLNVMRMTVHAMPEDRRTAIVTAARELQRSSGGFRAFAPLPRTMSVALPTTGYDDVKQVALARLMVDNIDCIQVDWPLYGPKLAQVALTMGADDVDGIAAVDPGTLGTRRSPIEEITGNIRAAHLQPAERNGLFEPRG